MRGQRREVWMVTDGPTAALEGELARLEVRVRRIPVERADEALASMPEHVVLFVQGAPPTVLGVLRAVRARGWKGRAAALTGPFEAPLYAELRPLADAIADRRSVGLAAVRRLLGWGEAETVSDARTRARVRTLAAALEASDGNLQRAADLLRTTTQNLRPELREWEDDMRFVQEGDHRRR